MSLPARAFSSTASRSQFNTYPGIYANVGGGVKKAGLPNSIGMNTAWDNIYLNNTSQNMKVLQTTVFPFVRQSRPVGSTLTPNSYWTANGIQF
jgi:hypothetical protein